MRGEQTTSLLFSLPENRGANSLRTDSSGRELSEGQQRYFQDVDPKQGSARRRQARNRPARSQNRRPAATARAVGGHCAGGIQ